MEHDTQTSRSLLLIKEKKRRRKKRRIFLAILIGLAAMAGGIFLWRSLQSAAQETIRIEAGEGETLTYARIDGIVGNEIQVSLMKKEDSKQGAAGFPSGGQADSSYEETGETRTWQIPVGTDVVTVLGVTTTFSRLAADDVIAVLTESGTDNILKIWIVR